MLQLSHALRVFNHRQCLCTLGGNSCFYNGVEYKDGASFKKECNTCTCHNGLAACTKIGCPGRQLFYGWFENRF